ncbi:MAG: DNRLRE domain-containing protein [Candidatus Krumholzibacteriia bacterium]
MRSLSMVSIRNSSFAAVAPVVAAAFLFGAVPAGAELTSFAAVADATIYEEDAQGANGAGEYAYAGSDTAGNVRRALLLFDLADIPATAEVDSVALQLSVTYRGQQLVRIDLKPATTSWTEGPSGGSGVSGEAPEMAVIGDVTWQYASYDHLEWTTPGGDYGDPVSESHVSEAGVHHWTGGAESLLAATVQGWIADPVANRGFMVRGDWLAETEADRWVQFATRENATPEHRPVLMVWWTLSTPAASAAWSDVKALYRR